MTYAGSASLYRDLKPTGEPHIGDLLIIPGYPGHVVIIIDIKKIDGVNYCLFANSWMPAQDIEIVSGRHCELANKGNYVPIRAYIDDIIQINGYNFNPYIHLRTWPDQN